MRAHDLVAQLCELTKRWTTYEDSVAYADGLTHTNTIEGFWALVKRAWYGQHHRYSRKYMPLYIGEAAYKYNYRSAKNGFDFALSRMVYA